LKTLLHQRQSSYLCLEIWSEFKSHFVAPTWLVVYLENIVTITLCTILNAKNPHPFEICRAEYSELMVLATSGEYVTSIPHCYTLLVLFLNKKCLYVRTFHISCHSTTCSTFSKINFVVKTMSALTMQESNNVITFCQISITTTFWFTCMHKQTWTQMIRVHPSVQSWTEFNALSMLNCTGAMQIMNGSNLNSV